MKLACVVATPDVGSLSLGWPGPLEEVLPALAQIGYGGVELQVRDPCAFDTAAVTNLISDHGLTITGVSSGPVGSEDKLYLTAPDAVVRQQAVDRLKSLIKFASTAGVPLAIGSVRGRVAWSEFGLDWLRAGFAELLECAKPLGVPILIEPQHRNVTDLFTTVEEALVFARDVAPPERLGLVCDTYHLASEERSVTGALVVAAQSGRLVSVQVSDSNRGAPGSGLINWQDILPVLRALKYTGWLVVECSPVPSAAESLIATSSLFAALDRSFA
jgi:sugar phosphate isomerase/epimerase